jgi:hypothetical protein
VYVTRTLAAAGAASGAAGGGTVAYAHQTAEGRTYYLHGKPVVLPNGRPLTVYYFAPRVKPREALEALPAGYEVRESPRAARPSLRLQRPA